MTAITKIYTAIADASLDPDAPLLSSLMYALRDNIVHTHEWLGASYGAGAVQDHNHDGLNSAALENGPNLVRNGSFESGTVGWTLTSYTGGTVAAVGVGSSVHGAGALSITSTVLANGGGDALTSAYIEVGENERFPWSVLVRASVANVSSKFEALWYDAGKALMSAQSLFSYTNTPLFGGVIQRAGSVVPPSNARFVRFRATGGVPASGTAVGTVFFDGIKFGDFGQVGALGNIVFITASGTYTKPNGLKAVRVRMVGGGAGGNTPSNTGGGGGGYCEKLIQASAMAATETVTIGAGGGATANGGATSFGAFCTANGGSSLGGGGSSSGGDVAITGGTATTTLGGDSVLSNSVGGPGATAAKLYGGGGGIGFVGAAGVIIVEELF